MIELQDHFNHECCLHKIPDTLHYGIIATTADFPVLTLYTLHNKRVATQFDLTSPSKLIANRTATVFLKDYYLLDFNPFYKSILELIDTLTLFQAIYLLVWNNFNIKISNEFIQFIDSLPQPLKEYLKTPMQKELDEYLASQKKSFWGSFFGKK